MSGPAGRLCHPMPLSELERRWAALRDLLREAKLDAAILQSANNLGASGTFARWLTGAVAANSYPVTVIFPVDGLMTMVRHGPIGGSADPQGDDPLHPGIGHLLFTTSFSSVAYTGGYDAELAVQAVRKAGYRRLALIGADGMYHGFAARLRATLSDLHFTDLTAEVDRLRAVKSDVEQDFIRRTAAMQDALFDKVAAFLRPGLHDYEVMAMAQHEGNLMGSETGYFLGSSAAPGQPAILRPRSQQGRRIEAGDQFLFQAENSGPGGYFTHACRLYVLGKAPQEVVDAHGAMAEAQAFTASLLRPGAASADIFAAYNDHMTARGYPAERRLHCHGQGLDAVERPLIRFDEDMRIAAHMNIGIHPSCGSASHFVTLCDNFLVGPDGAERLHRTPQHIFEL